MSACISIKHKSRLRAAFVLGRGGSRSVQKMTFRFHSRSRDERIHALLRSVRTRPAVLPSSNCGTKMSVVRVRSTLYKLLKMPDFRQPLADSAHMQADLSACVGDELGNAVVPVTDLLQIDALEQLCICLLKVFHGYGCEDGGFLRYARLVRS